MLKNSLYLLSAAALLVLSCEKNTVPVQDTLVTSGARVKLFHAAPEAPGVNLFVNEQKISANTPVGATVTNPGTPAPIVFGGTFPGATNANYAVIGTAAGQQKTVKISAPASGTVTSETVLYNQPVTLEDNKYYTLFVAGAGTQPEVLLVNDDFSSATDANKYYVRFVNLITGANEYDLALSNGTVIVPKLAYKASSAFVPVDGALASTFSLRLAGTTTAVGSNYNFTGSTSGRVLTIVAVGIPGRTGTVAPRITGYINR